MANIEVKNGELNRKKTDPVFYLQAIQVFSIKLR